jgi:hypothetical protein
MGKVEYIGGGVYAIFDALRNLKSNRRSGIWLHANHPENPTDRVYLEPQELKLLNDFAARCYAKCDCPVQGFTVTHKANCEFYE